MAAYAKFHQFVEALAFKEHDLETDSLKIALCAAASAPDPATDAVLADLTQISYTNCSSRALVIDSAGQTTGTFKLILDDLTITASGGAVGPFRYVILYNDTHASDGLIGYWDLGSEVTLADTQEFLFDFNNTDGVIQLV